MTMAASGPVPARLPSDVKLWRYAFSSQRKPQFLGWAIFVLGADGYFSAVSDYGAYAYLFTHHERADFREFVLACDTEYLCEKLHPQKEYDGRSTLEFVREEIERRREDGRFAGKEARKELKLLERFEDLHTQLDFNRWVDETEIQSAWECAIYSHPPRVVHFVEKCVKARLVPQLREDLTMEKQRAVEETSRRSKL